MELGTFVNLLVEDGLVPRMMNNPLAQLGPVERAYLGATLLPEEMRDSNEYKEKAIRYRTIVANAGTRYSQPQKKGGLLIGSFSVELGESDAGAEFTSQEYDFIRNMIRDLPENTTISDVPMAQMTIILRWVETNLLLPLLEHNEKNRWQAILNAEIQLTGDNEYAETVSYSNPAGHRVNVGGDWASDSYDPMDDIMAHVQLLEDKGYKVSRIVTSSAAKNKLKRNQKMAQRLGALSIMSGTVAGLTANVTNDRLNSYLAEEEVPPIETYNLSYATQLGTVKFFDVTKMAFFATTGRTAELDFGDANPLFLHNTIGYTGIGTPANRNTPGRASVLRYEDGKGAPMTGESWQTSLPVILEPEAIAVLGNI